MNIDSITTMAAVEALPQEVSSTISGVNTVQKAYGSDSTSRQPEKTVTQESKLSPEETRQLAEELNEISEDLQTNLGFSIHEDLDRTIIVEIKNQDTNELIRQIPSEELLTIKEKMLELTGLILDQNV